MIEKFLRLINSHEENNRMDFIKNPQNFLRKHPINAFGMYNKIDRQHLDQPDGIYSFSISNGKNEERQLVLERGNDHSKTFGAYLLEYRSEINSKEEIKELRIPKKNPLVHYVFTATLTGCSVVVENAEDFYRVYHDPRPYNPEEYPNVVAVFGPKDVEYYDQELDEIGVLGFSAMIYDEESAQWLLTGQALKHGELNRETGGQPMFFNPEKGDLIVKALPTLTTTSVLGRLQGEPLMIKPEREIKVTLPSEKELTTSVQTLFGFDGPFRKSKDQEKELPKEENLIETQTSTHNMNR